MVILYSLMEFRVMRYNELKRYIPSISHKSLSASLKELERDRLIIRKEYPQVPPKVEYRLSERGISLMKILDQLCTWGEENRPYAKCSTWNILISALRSVGGVADMGHVYTTVVLDPIVLRRHAVAEGNPLGRGVGVPNDGTDLLCLQNVKGVLFAGLCSFGCIALVPAVPAEQIANFQNLPVLPGLHGQTALADHLTRLL